MFGVFVLPHLQTWFSIQNEIKETQNRVTTIRDNIRLIQNTNTVAIDEEYTLAVQALPHDRDFAGILQSIAQASLKSNVEVSDYSFSLGTIVNNKEDISKTKLLPITTSIAISGNIDNVMKFTDEIEKELPLVEVKGITYSSGKAEISLSFFIKEFPDLKIINSVPLTQLTQKDRELLNTLRTWSAVE
jgi:Tfp pilus assembly protein PilO